MVWIKRRSHLMSDTFFEGQLKGTLFLRDLNHERELKIPNDFTDKIKCIHYDGNKNLLFVSSKDGKSKCWKLPSMWQNLLLEQMTQESTFKQHLENQRSGNINQRHKTI